MKLLLTTIYFMCTLIASAHPAQQSPSRTVEPEDLETPMHTTELMAGAAYTPSENAAEQTRVPSPLLHPRPTRPVEQWEL